MRARAVLEQRALNIFAILVAAPQFAHGTDVACSDGSCGASGTVLLSISSGTKRVSWPEEGVGAQLQSAVAETPPQPLALQEMPMSRQQVLASQESDSDDDDGGAVPADTGIDLEYDEENEDEFHQFHQYVESTGYTEKADVSFSPDVWNNLPEVRASHNCYMYALNDLSPRSGERCKHTQSLIDQGRLDVKKKDAPRACKRHFHKPGYYFQNFVSGLAHTDVWNREETTCHLMNPMLAADSPAMTWNNEQNKTLEEDDACPESHYMAALFIHPKAGFHFYRRDHFCHDNPSKLCWSHKPGILEATDKDASGKTITSVLQANRDYGQLNYSQHCAFFCVPQNARARTHSDSRRA